MDMLPEKELDPSEPSDEGSAAQPAGQPEAAAPQQAEEESSALDERLAGAASAANEPEPSASRRPSFDEALGEMRQTLREEETKEKTGFGAGVRRWVQKVLRRKTAPLPEVTEARLDEFAIPEAPHAAAPTPSAGAAEAAAVSEGAQEAAEEVEEQAQGPATEASSFQKLVHQRITGALPGKEHMEPLVAQPEPATEDQALDFLAPGQEHLKEQVEQPPAVEPAEGQSILAAIRGEQEETQEVSSIRQAALEDYVVAPADEEAAEAAAPLPRRLRRGWRDMRPIDRTLLTGALGLLAVVVVGLSAYTAYTIFVPTATPPPATPTTSIVPIPISLTLPGIPPFALKPGKPDADGSWRPNGNEWLQGTEICRWVALSYSPQVEAVLRTLNRNDPIQISMSNYDSVVFKVQSIDEKPLAEIPKLCPEAPALLVILQKQGSPTYFVVTAVAQQ